MKSIRESAIKPKKIKKVSEAEALLADLEADEEKCSNKSGSPQSTR